MCIRDRTGDKITPPAPEFIGLEKAKQIALEDAGLDETAQKIVFTREELSRNQGKPCYILEFYTDKCCLLYTSQDRRPAEQRMNQRVFGGSQRRNATGCWHPRVFRAHFYVAFAVSLWLVARRCLRFSAGRKHFSHPRPSQCPPRAPFAPCCLLYTSRCV